MLSSSVASSHARVFVSQILNKSAYTHTHRHTEDRHMAKRCSKMLDTKRNLYLFLSFPQGLPPALTRRLSHCPLPSSWTWEPHGEAESQSLAQAWSGLSWSHNCGSLVNDRLRNLIPHTHTHTHISIYTHRQHPTPTSLWVSWSSRSSLSTCKVFQPKLQAVSDSPPTTNNQ